MCISIHALLAESDRITNIQPRIASISIHALLAESDSKPRVRSSTPKLFLSTLSLRRATHYLLQAASRPCYFYPRSPCGERLRRCTGFQSLTDISIHALLAESDHPKMSDHPHNTNFYPRSPCGERRNRPVTMHTWQNFYPRSPCGERLITIITICIALKFLSTLSLRRATLHDGRVNLFGFHFYPRSPCGERPSGVDSCSICSCISIHALLAESDRMPARQRQTLRYFYPRSPCGERLIALV